MPELAEILMQSDSGEDFINELLSEDSNDDESTSDNDANDDIEEPQHNKRAQINNEYQWKSTSLFKLKIHDFNNVYSGPTKGHAGFTELECFTMNFTEEIVTKIAEETNLYFQFVITQTSSKDRSRLKRWKDTVFKEIYCFFTVNLLMYQVK